ncbi:MAG: MOSC domain-containing protein [Ignavibacteria bacterium]|nr:MAG: MOSC domain-containing protein [Ignavibacteria bacterium]
MSQYKITGIYIYPIKSLGGISLQSSLVEERGLQYDRRWMLVDEQNKFITQRLHPKMALLTVEINNDLLTIKHKQNKLSPLTIPPLPYDEEEINVQIWKDNVTTIKYSHDANDWFTEAIGFKCCLVYMPDSTKRKVDSKYAKDKMVSFADGYPFLIIGEESLNDLNKRLEEPLPMTRFRTNFDFSGGKPFDEDNWKTIKIGEMVFHSTKSCPRCVITTIDQNTGTKDKEPLKTLATFRQKDNRVLFGMNMVANGTGKVNVGDEIKQLPL